MDDQNLNSEVREESPRKRGSDYLIPGSILLSGIIIALAIVFVLGGESKAPTLQNLGNNGGEPSVQPTLGERDVVLGDSNAPISIVEYGDYQCPFCARFFVQTESLLREEYIKTGKAKMVFRNFQFLGPESQAAGEAAECAKDQKQFWAFHDAIYQEEFEDERENNGNLNRDFFMKVARDLKLDEKVFGECIDSRKYKTAVEDETEGARQFGVESTPTTFVNDQKILGAVPYEYFKSAIDGILNGAN